MGVFETIVVLAIVGFLLIAAETFVPGLVLGILGGFCLIGAVVMAYVNYGILTGSFVFAGLSIFTLGGFVAWLFVFPHTPIGRRVMLGKSLPGKESLPSAQLVGRDGEALTPLRPAGNARVDGRKIDVVAESEFIAAGEAVTVIRDEGFRIVVRKKL